jgi:endonuclease/exonuclease/phosphatase family metal-dependent hydrolase
MRRPKWGQAGGTGSALSVTSLVVLTLAAALLAAFAGIRCREDDATPNPPRTAIATPTVTTAVARAASETPEPPREFRVAFINLLSPLTVDANNQEAGETFDERLDLVIKALKAYNPDLIAFNEASVTKAYGSAITRLAKELKMEFQYARANPWYPGQTKEQSDDLAKQIGFEEGELILSRYPIKDGSQRYALNPRTSESGEVRAALHVVVKGPGSLGDIDVYVTHLTGGSDKTRRAQVADFTSFVATTRGTGPTIAMVGDPDISLTNDLYQAIGLHDVAGEADAFTCCRDSVIGEQPPVTGRADYLMSDRWKPMSWSIFGDEPSPRADGTLLYPSDHNGIWATFAVPAPASLP